MGYAAQTSVTSGFTKFREEAKNGEVKNADELDYSELVAGVRKTFESGRTKDLKWRKQQLRQLKAMVFNEHEKIASAITRDHGGPKFRGAVS